MSKIRIALIGAGNIANAHLTAYQQVPDAEIVAICDQNAAHLEKTADKFNIPNRFTDLDAMLAADLHLDAADVCVWNC